MFGKLKLPLWKLAEKPSVEKSIVNKSFYSNYKTKNRMSDALEKLLKGQEATAPAQNNNVHQKLCLRCTENEGTSIWIQSGKGTKMNWTDEKKQEKEEEEEKWL